MVGVVVKANIGELEEEVSAGCLGRMREELTGLVQRKLRKKRLFMRFQGGCENNLFSNQLAIMIVEKILEDKEPKVFTNPGIPE